MRRLTSITGGRPAHHLPRRFVTARALAISVLSCLILMMSACDRSTEHIIFVPLDAYDPYPYLSAEGAGSDAAMTTMWRARQVVLEGEVVARYAARAAEYNAFLEAMSSTEIERKPRPVRVVTLDRPVDINRADATELQRLPRVGPATAARIIAGRPYHRPGDLLRVRGIGPRTMEQLAPLIVVGGR